MKSTTRFKHNNRGIECLNCKQPISDADNFCSNCGQVNDELPLSIKQFVSEFFAGFFSFDTRFFKTFIPLLFKPGKVSKEYIKGKRRKYVNPFQLYLHVTIVFFLLQGLFSAFDEYKVSGSFSKNNKAEKETDSTMRIGNIIAKEIQENIIIKGDTENNSTFSSKDSIEHLKKDSLANAFNPPLSKKSTKDSLLNIAFEKTKYHIDSIFKNTNILKQLNNNKLSSVQKDSVFDPLYVSTLSFISKLEDDKKLESIGEFEYLSLLKKDAFKNISNRLKSENISYVLPEKTKLSVEDELLKNVLGQQVFKKIAVFMKYNESHKETSVLQALDDLDYEKTRWNIFYFKKSQDFNKFKNDSNFRNSYLDNVISKISIALFFMLPLFTLFLSLLYIRGDKNYTEHLVFVFNVQTVFFLLLIFFVFINRIFKTDIGIALFTLTFLFYLYKSLRNFYKQNRFKTIVKFFMLNTIYILLSSFGVIIISFIAFVF